VQSMTGIDDASMVTVHTNDGTWTAKYVVGCDGANSVVRDLMEVSTTDLGFFYDWLIVDTVIHEPRTWEPTNLQICDPQRPISVVSGGPGHRRWEFMKLPHETVEELNTIERAWELLEPWKLNAENTTIERHTVYTFQARWVDTWRKGRALLAGDSAHLMPPFAGQGMCSGIRDSINVAWKLDLVLRGLVPDAVLDQYTLERSDNVRAMINASVEFGRIVCMSDPAEADARDEFMKSLLDPSGAPAEMPPQPGVTQGIVRAGQPASGSIFVQSLVSGNGATRRGDDVFGLGFRLYVRNETVDVSLSPATLQWFESIGGAVVTMSSSQDVNGDYERWFTRFGCDVALQRPDGIVFGCENASDAETLVSDLRNALLAPAA
jgi:hypothetical protein